MNKIAHRVVLSFLTVLLSATPQIAAQEDDVPPKTEAPASDQTGDKTQDETDEAVNAIEDEIVVTARKREEVISDVPISISLITGDMIQEFDISDMDQLADAAPNFHHSNDVNSFDRFIVRGLGTTGSTLGFEEAVGQVIDGFFFGRSRFGRTMFLDLERVEVLKGPQGALIGKNNSVGAINITTRKPGSGFGGYANVTADFEDAQGYAVESAVDVPISPTQRARFAVRYEDKDGWMKNFGNGRVEQQREDFTARGILDWNLSDTLFAEILVQAGDLNHNGREREVYNCVGDATSANPRDPAEDCVFNSEKDSLFLVNGQPDPEAHDTEYSLFGLTLNKYFDRFSVSYLGNYAQYKSADDWDSDYTDIEWTGIFVRDDWDQTSHELRFASLGGGKLDYLAGIYTSDQSNDYIQSFMFCRAPFALCTGGNTNPAFRGLQRHGEGVMNTESLSFFSQIDWHWNEQFTLTVGGRFTEENRDIQTLATVLTPYALEITPTTLVDCPNESDAIDGVGVPIGFDCGPARFSSSGFFDRRESDFTPNVTLRWKPRDRSMFYATYSEGFKSGGFLFPTYVPQSQLTSDLVEYEDETTTHYEIGGKNILAGGRLRLNWALWSTDFNDVQVSALDPVTVIQNVNNAAQAKSEGVEVDFTWRFGKRTALTATGAYTDARFEQFRTAPCYSGQSREQGCFPLTLPNGSVEEVQDLSGTQLAYAPKWQYSLRLHGDDLPLAGNFVFGYDLFYFWKDDFHFVLANDPIDSQSAFGKVNVVFRVGPRDAAWTISLIGKNLGDKLTASAGDSTAAIGQAGDIGPTPNFKFAEPGRQIALQLGYRF